MSRKIAGVAPARTTVAAAGLLLAAGLAACGSGSTGSASSSGGPVTVTYWTSQTQAETSYIDTQFDKTHPGIKAVGQYIASADETEAKEVAALKAGTSRTWSSARTRPCCRCSPRAARSST